MRATKVTKLIAVEQIIGSIVLSIMIIAQMIYLNFYVQGFFLFILYGMIGIFLLASVYTGVGGYLIFKNDKLGYKISIASQLFQSITLKAVGLSYKLLMGTWVLIFLGIESKKPSFSVSGELSGGSSYYASFDPGKLTAFEIGINLIALFCAIYLIKQYKKFKL